MESSSRVFSVPSAERRKRALGDLTLLRKKEYLYFTHLVNFFKPVPAPGPDDWLANQIEHGQSFSEFTNKIVAQDNLKKKKIMYILPLEQGIEGEFLEKLSKFATAFFFGVEVKTLGYDDKLLKVRSRGEGRHRQLHAGDILQVVNKIKPHAAFCVIGVCFTDLFSRYESNFVFGLASLTSHVGVFSFARYIGSKFNMSEEGMIQKAIRDDDVLYRSCKVMCHELTHQFGIKHCIYYHCLMNGSNTDEEALKKPYELCPVCLRKLHYVLKFDIQDRFTALTIAAKAMNTHQFSIEAFVYKNLIIPQPESQQKQTNRLLQK